METSPGSNGKSAAEHGSNIFRLFFNLPSVSCGSYNFTTGCPNFARASSESWQNDMFTYHLEESIGTLFQQRDWVLKSPNIRWPHSTDGHCSGLQFRNAKRMFCICAPRTLVGIHTNASEHRRSTKFLARDIFTRAHAQQHSLPHIISVESPRKSRPLRINPSLYYEIRNFTININNCPSFNTYMSGKTQLIRSRAQIVSGNFSPSPPVLLLLLLRGINFDDAFSD